jgi:hypothetical protein
MLHVFQQFLAACTIYLRPEAWFFSKYEIGRFFLQLAVTSAQMSKSQISEKAASMRTLTLEVSTCSK